MFQIRIRAVVGVMIFFGYFLMYIVRYNLSVHIVDMAQILKRKVNYRNATSPAITRNSMRIKLSVGNIVDIINLDDKRIAQLFASYHIGYCICFPIFHNIGDRFGPTRVVAFAGITSGVLNCLTPAAAYFNVWTLFLVRILKGFCAGAMQPSMVQILRHWVPPMERNHFMWAYCGITTGTFSTFLICAAVQYYSRWPIGFYICGGAQILWAALWILAVTDYPRKHPFISRDELLYLGNTIGNIFTIKLMNFHTPWDLILRSVPFWALCILNFGYSWMIISLCIHGPIFYTRVVEYSIYSASVLTGLPFFLRLVLGTIVIQVFHWYKHKSKIKRIKYMRKYIIVVSHVMPGLLVASLWMFNIIPGPVLLTLAVSLTAAGMDLTLDLSYELSPTYVNSITTVIKIIGNISGIVVSFSVGEVTQKYKNSPYIWKHIWCFHATVLLASGLIFLIWGETHIQPWNAVRNRPYRPRHKVRAMPRPSAMSNIVEVDEDSYSMQLPNQSKKNSLMKTLKISQSKV